MSRIFGITAFDSDTFLDGNEGFYFGVKAQDQLVVTAQPTTSVLAGQQFDVKVSADDANGNLDTNFTDNVTMALANNPGNSTLGGTTMVKAVGGVADFGNLTLDHAGQGYTLTATSGTASPATTSPFDVNDQLVVTTQPPTGVLAGNQFDVKISAEDVNGKVDKNFTGNVTMVLANSPGNSTFGGTLTVAANAGVADFGNLTLDHAGQGYTLTATSNTATTATTSPFDVNILVTPTSLDWDKVQGGVNFNYTVSSPVLQDISISLYWASGPDVAGVTDDNPVYTYTVPAGTMPQGAEYGPIHVPGSELKGAPTDATDLLAVAEPDGSLQDADPAVNVASMQLVLNVFPFYQVGSPWSSDDLGQSSQTIAKSGCLLTDLAMQLNYEGISTNPGLLTESRINNDILCGYGYAGIADKSS